MTKRPIVAIAVLVLPTLTTTTHAQGDPFEDLGHLNSLERQTAFWLDATATAYTPGSCGFFLEAGAGELLNIMASIADDGDEPLVWAVGTFQLTTELPLQPPDTSEVHVEETTYGVMLLVNDFERTVISGFASFDTGFATDLTAVSFVSGTTEMISSEYWTGDNVFVPIRTHETGAAARMDAYATSLAYTAISVAPPDKDLTAQQREIIDQIDDDEVDPDCPWTWCHRPDQFCEDIAQCVADRDEQIADALAARTACLAAAGAGYVVCMDAVGCWPFPGGIGCAAADIACSAARSIAEAACRAAYLGLATAAEWNFQACGANAKANNGQVVPGCDCPDGWEPFPTQAPPDWSHVDCADVFGVWGLTWSYELIFD